MDRAKQDGEPRRTSGQYLGLTGNTIIGVTTDDGTGL